MHYTINKNIKIPFTDVYLVEGSVVDIVGFCDFPYVKIQVTDAPDRKGKQARQGDVWAVRLGVLC